MAWVLEFFPAVIAGVGLEMFSICEGFADDFRFFSAFSAKRHLEPLVALVAFLLGFLSGLEFGSLPAVGTKGHYTVFPDVSVNLFC